MLTDTKLIDTSAPESFAFSSGLFGAFEYAKNATPSGTLYVYGAQFIRQNYDGTNEYRRYPITSLTANNISNVAPNMTAEIVPLTDSEGNQAFEVRFTGNLKDATNGDVSITYRDGLNPPVNTTKLSDFPSTASLTSISHPFQKTETIPMRFTVVAENKTYNLVVGIIVFHDNVVFPAQTATRAAVRKGHKEADHGYGIKGATGASEDVFINGFGAHRKGDDWPKHFRGDDVHPAPGDTRTTNAGSSSVYINGEPLAMIANGIANCGNKIAEGSETVFTGE